MHRKQNHSVWALGSSGSSKALRSYSLHQPVCPWKASFQGDGSQSPFLAWTPPRSPQVPPFSDAPGRGRGAGGNLTAPPASEQAHISSGFSLNGTPQWREENGMDGHCPQSLECLPLPAQVLGPPWSPGLTQTVMLPFGRNVCCLHVKRHFNAQENVVGRRALRDRDSLSLKKKNHLDVLIVTLHTLSARRRVDWGDWVLLTKPIYVSLSEFTT